MLESLRPSCVCCTNIDANDTPTETVLDIATPRQHAPTCPVARQQEMLRQQQQQLLNESFVNIRINNQCIFSAQTNGMTKADSVRYCPVHGTVTTQQSTNELSPLNR